MASYSKMIANGAAGLRTGWSFAVALQTLAAWRRCARSRRALRKLDRHMLRDIGLTEVEANRECARRFWQD